MTLTDLVTLLPLLVLAASAVGVMLQIAFYRHHRLTLSLTLAGLALAALALPLSAGTGSGRVTELLVVDGYARFYTGLLLLTTLVIAAISYSYLNRRTSLHPEEYYLLLLLATLGGAVLAASNHFASFFLGLELLSVSLYGLLAYLRTDRRGLEAGLKYLILAAAAAAFLLFGLALIYAATGTMAFDRLAQAAAGTSGGGLLLTGLAMTVIGIGFKLAVVPFHLWTPDVYEGAPAPVTAFVATVSKGAMFALLLRYFGAIDLYRYPSLVLVFGLIAIASMLVGNLLALLQTNVKRILAYSSIAHLGYLLVAFLAGSALAVTAATFYLVAYFATILAAFGVVSALSGPERDAAEMADYRGLFWRRPWLAAILTISLFSLAGIPLTAGFIGKFYLLTAGIESTLWLLVLTLVVGSAISLYYYLRIVVTMYLPADGPETAPALSLAGNLVLAAPVGLLLWLGLYPAPIITMIETMIANFA